MSEDDHMPVGRGNHNKGPEPKNISTEHQEQGDARRPSDTLDKDRSGSANYKTSVEDRPNVGMVKPDDYPSQQ